MPRALEPGRVFDIVLESDKDKPKETQPAFQYRTLNGREWRKIASVQDRLETDESFNRASEVLDVIYDACSTGLVGWKNMVGPDGPISFDPANLDLVVDPVEARDLLLKVMAASQVDVEDKKKSESQASLGMNVSAKDAAPQNAQASPVN